MCGKTCWDKSNREQTTTKNLVEPAFNMYRRLLKKKKKKRDHSGDPLYPLQCNDLVIVDYKREEKKVVP